MCIAQHRFNIWSRGAQELSDIEKSAVQQFEEDRQLQIRNDPPRGLQPSPSFGWQCPNCGRAHAPDVGTCPDPPRGGSLRERLKAG